MLGRFASVRLRTPFSPSRTMSTGRARGSAANTGMRNGLHRGVINQAPGLTVNVRSDGRRDWSFSAGNRAWWAYSEFTKTRRTRASGCAGVRVEERSARPRVLNRAELRFVAVLTTLWSPGDLLQSYAVSFAGLVDGTVKSAWTGTRKNFELYTVGIVGKSLGRMTRVVNANFSSLMSFVNVRWLQEAAVYRSASFWYS